MRRAALWGIAGWLALLAGPAAWGLGTVWVAPSASDAGSGDEFDPVRTIAAGLALAGSEADATLRIQPGAYEPGVEVRKGPGKLTLRGVHHDNEPKADRHTVLKSFLRVDRRPVALENLVLLGPKDSADTLVRISNAREATLTHCVIATGGPALAISRCPKVRIENCTFIGHGSVVALDGCGEVEIIGCTVAAALGLGAPYGYVGKRDVWKLFWGVSATDCESLTLTGCTVQAPQRAGNALWVRRVGKLQADGNRYWGVFTTVLDGERVAPTIEDWREMSGQDAASRLIRIEHVADPVYGCRPDPRSPWDGPPNLTLPVPTASVVSIGIFDAKGAQIRTLANEYETRDATEVKLHWDGSDNLRVPAPPVSYVAKVFRRELAVRQSWIGNSGGSDDFVQPVIEDLCLVPSKGFLVTNSACDAAARQAGAYGLEGKARHGFGDLSGWGRSGGEAVAATSEYVFVACRQGHVEGARTGYPPKGEAWYCVRRYRPDGSFAPWGHGQGWNRTLLVIDKVPCIAGLAASGSRLYVCDSQAHAIRVFDTGTMDEIRRFPFEFPGRIAAESSGAFWVVHTPDPGQRASVVRCDAADGKPAARIDGLAAPAALCLDEARGRLLIADNGPHQILLYDIRSNPPKPAGTLGVRDGIYADPPGKAGDLRFNRLTGVAADAEGNVYVATSGVETSPAGAEIRKLSPQGSLVWRLQGLLGVESAAPDPDSPEDVYTPRQRFRLDYTKDPPTWELAAWTLRPDRYDDPRSNANYASVQVRRLLGKTILFAADAEVKRVAFFRFDGDIAVPAGLLSEQSRPGEWPRGQPAKGRWIWCDANGDGKIDPDETSVPPPKKPGELTPSMAEEPRPWDWFADAVGRIWRCGGQGQILTYCPQVRVGEGTPFFLFADVRPLPILKPFSGLHAIEYHTHPESIYLSGSNKEFRGEASDACAPAGCLLGRYVSSPMPRWLVPTDTGLMTQAFCVAGDLVFATDTFKAAVQVYDTETGLRIGVFGPGKALGYQSGTCDFARCLRAHRLPSGEYIVFNADGWKAKVILYRVRCGLKEVSSKPVTRGEERKP